VLAICGCIANDVTMISRQRATVVIRSIYLYGVCLITLVTSLFAAVGAVSATVDIVYPDPYVGYYNPYPSRVVDSESGTTTAVDPEAEAAWQEREAEISKEANRRSAIRSVFRSIVTLIFAVPLFVLHWRAAQKERLVDSAQE
jgi:hypothetical protein